MASFKNNWPFLIGLILTISLLWPLLWAPYFAHQDDVQIIRLYEMSKCLTDHQIPCRWVPDLGGLYGYPLFNYYAPLPYYFGAIVYLLTHNLLISFKLMFAVSFLGAYVFMYLLAAKFWGKLGGSLAAIFYSFAPYHAVDFYIRGAMGEMWALMFFPAIFWAVYKLKEKTNILYLLLLGIVLAGLLVSHNLSAMIFLPVTLIWVVLLFLKRKSRQFLWMVSAAAVLGISLSAFYTLPVLVEKDLVHVETTVVGYFSYTEHFKGFRKLLLDRSWGYGPSVREIPGGERDGLPYQIGWAQLVGLLLAGLTVKKLWRQQKDLSSNRWFCLIIAFGILLVLFSAFMIHPRSEFIWKMIDPLRYLQFPWRFLILVIFFTSFVSGSFFLMSIKNKRLWWAALVIGAVILNFAYFVPEKFIQTSDEKLLSGQDWDKQIKRSIFDYLPIYAKEPPAELATARYQILTGDSQIYDFSEGTNWFSFKAATNSHTIIRLSQYYFPQWKVFVDGKEAKVEYKNNSLGLMTIILGKGNHQIWGKLYDTPIRTIANLITLISSAVVVILLLVSSCRFRRWLTYYQKRMN